MSSSEQPFPTGSVARPPSPIRLPGCSISPPIAVCCRCRASNVAAQPSYRPRFDSADYGPSPAPGESLPPAPTKRADSTAMAAPVDRAGSLRKPRPNFSRRTAFCRPPSRTAPLRTKTSPCVRPTPWPLLAPATCKPQFPASLRDSSGAAHPTPQRRFRSRH